ncbi:hypothetical protein JXJ21_09375 [candidate division KSB1 bacterium]|nr:hypothetical protein [candidate division KSB1 bacterium]
MTKSEIIGKMHFTGFKPFSKWKCTLILLPVCIYFIAEREQYSFLDKVDLIIHEAGHFVFALFGEFIHAAGGTLMQIIYPALMARYFYKSGLLSLTQIFGFWLGQNLLNLSVYATDASARKLPLLGGGMHDWFYMLSRLGILEHAQFVSGCFVSLAIIVFALVLITPLFFEGRIRIFVEEPYTIN